MKRREEIKVILELTPQASSDFTNVLLKIYEQEKKKQLKEVS